GDASPPLRHVHRRGGGQADVAIEAAAGIPARGFGRVVEPDRKLVAGAEFDVGREVHAPAVVAIGPAADEPAVEPDAGVGHRAADVEIHAPALVRCGNVEAAAVPADAPARQPAHA